MQISRIIAQNTCNSMSTNNRQNKPDSLNYIKMPLANYNLKQDTTSFTGFGDYSSMDFDYGNQDVIFDNPVRTRGSIRAGSLVAYKEFTAGSVNAGKADFWDKTTVSRNVKTGALTADKEFTAGSVDTKGYIAKFKGITKIAESLETGVLRTDPSSELTVKNINITDPYHSLILGSLEADSIETTGNLNLGKIIKLKEIVINPHNKNLDPTDPTKIVEKYLKFNSSEIRPDFINIKLGDIYRITVYAPDENTFKKLVFHVADGVKEGTTLWKKLSEVEVAEFIKSGNIVKIIKSVI